MSIRRHRMKSGNSYYQENWDTVNDRHYSQEDKNIHKYYKTFEDLPPLRKKREKSAGNRQMVYSIELISDSFDETIVQVKAACDIAGMIKV